MIHRLDDSEPRKCRFPHKRKTVEMIAELKRSKRATATEIAERCDVASANVMNTLRLLEEYGLVRFAGWGERRANGGHFPATWEWV